MNSLPSSSISVVSSSLSYGVMSRMPQCGHVSSHMQDHSSAHRRLQRSHLYKLRNQAIASLLGSQTIISARDEINKSAITQILKLLTYLRLDVLVAGIEIAEMPLESVDLVKREVSLAERFHALDDIEQPAPRLRRFISEKKRP